MSGDPSSIKHAAADDVRWGHVGDNRTMARVVRSSPTLLRWRISRAWALIAAPLLVGAALVTGASASSGAEANGSVRMSSDIGPTSAIAKTADLSQFKPGNIISDAVFFNAGTMSEAQIQSFLESKVATCRSGYTCLKDYYVQTRSIASDAMCGAYAGGEVERASRVIYKVAQACGINPQVILVMLQKEQGLVTSTAPSSWAYQAAMGQGCPDTAACDVRYYGLFNQVHGGAWQLKRYANPPGTSNFFTWYSPGRTWNVLYHPNASCGRGPVFIENQATANLYYYTPYQPNQAALSAGYGLGDACSSYGNRNFFNYFTDWFGSTQGFGVPAEFADVYAANRAWLGHPRSAVSCSSEGCVQSFEGGMIARGPSGVFAVTNAYTTTWGNYGREFGPLGFPASARSCADMQDACRQEFAGGWLVSNDRIGVRLVATDVRTVWGYWGREYGPLGLPLTDAQCSSSRFCIQVFEGGWVVSHDDIGIRVVPNSSVTTWSNWGRELNILGMPTSDPTPTNWDNYTQQFQGGVITVTNGQGRLTSSTDPWVGTALANTWLGATQSAGPLCTLNGGNCYRPYDGGWIVQSNAGTFALPREVVRVWSDWGREYNILGYPTSAPSANPTNGNYTQQFQGGVITVTNGQGSKD